MTTPDVTLTPLVKNLIGGVGTAGLLVKGALHQAANLIDTAEMNYVSRLNDPHVASIDINALLNNFTQNENSTIDGMYVDPNGAGPLATDLFVGDSFHPGTVAQGILAQNIAEQIDKWYPNAITPISDSEIVAQALATQPVTQTSLQAPAVATQGSPVTLNVTVNPFTPKFPPYTSDQYPFPNPSGSVTFLDSFNGATTVLGTAELSSSPAPTISNGVANFTTSALPAGDDVITAVYNGNTVYPPASPAPAQVVVTDN